MKKITPCLWFDDQAEQAVEFYTSVFKDSKVGQVTRFGKEGFEIHGRPEGSVMAIEFDINGQTFTALNGGPIFKFSEAISMQVFCDTQEEVDYYWEKLSQHGDPAAQQCGWIKDQFGLSWQVVPTILGELMRSSDPGKAGRVMNAMLKMKKLDIEKLKQAFEG